MPANDARCGQAASPSACHCRELDPAHGGPSYSVPRLSAKPSPPQEPNRRFCPLPRGATRPCDTRDKGYPDRRFAQDLARIPGLRALRRSAAFSAALDEAAGRADWFTITA